MLEAQWHKPHALAYIQKLKRQESHLHFAIIIWIYPSCHVMEMTHYSGVPTPSGLVPSRMEWIECILWRWKFHTEMWILNEYVITNPVSKQGQVWRSIFHIAKWICWVIKTFSLPFHLNDDEWQRSILLLIFCAGLLCCYTETTLPNHITTRRHEPEDQDMDLHRNEALTSYWKFGWFFMQSAIFRYAMWSSSYQQHTEMLLLIVPHRNK
jgi:hypothetical protein